MGVLTTPVPSCDKSPDPEPRGPDDSTVDVRRERIDCMLDDNKNGTLVELVFGMDPPCWEIGKAQIIMSSMQIQFGVCH